ncbi:hypothetical protein [Natrialba taiwanensis]|uniref:hypothetical protein n=1 Tax=Natrialba taiwanensis TaxID=160846 RepID=UPI000A4AD4E1|nr:hypothetical protein [Natrialba taiwanensis]
MSNSGIGRRTVLIAVSGGYGALAGCSSGDVSESAESASRSGYGTAYGQGYGTT